MSRREDYEARFEAMLGPVAEANNVTIYDVEYVKEGSDYYLRAYIDKEDGVTIEDCEAVSRAVSDLLDQDDFIADAYILEVSSPGLGRALKKDRHFEQSIGLSVELKTYKPVFGSKEHAGILVDYTSDTITLLPDEEKPDETLVFTRKDVAGVRLAIDF